MMTPSRMTFLKPASSKATLYVPIGMRANRYAPLSTVVVVCGWMSAGDVNITVTPGITAFETSVTLPKISPVLTCAPAGTAPASSAIQTSTATRRHSLIHPPGAPERAPPPPDVAKSHGDRYWDESLEASGS